MKPDPEIQSIDMSCCGIYNSIMIIGLTTGCFDLLHYSHLLYLQRCKSLCDKLIVGVDSDDMIEKAKGPLRPIIPENERFDLINNLEVVSKTFILKSLEEIPEMVKRFGVTRIFKHESFFYIDKVIGVDGTGAELVIVPDIPNMVSTTEIIDRIVKRYVRK